MSYRRRLTALCQRVMIGRAALMVSDMVKEAPDDARPDMRAAIVHPYTRTAQVTIWPLVNDDWTSRMWAM